MKTRHVLLAILLAVAVLLYLVHHQRNRRHHHRHGKARSKLAAKAASAILPANPGPCDYFAEDPTNPSGANPALLTPCKAYQAACGLSSTANEVLNIEESASGDQDPRILQWITGDAKAVQTDKGKCAPSMLCPDGQTDCPSEFPLKCVRGSCQ